MFQTKFAKIGVGKSRFLVLFFFVLLYLLVRRRLCLKLTFLDVYLRHLVESEYWTNETQLLDNVMFATIPNNLTNCFDILGICWDQWFPEAARAMVLQGAEILFYPTAIGSEPQDDGLDSRDHWKRVMQGHAGANVVCWLMNSLC